MAKRKRKAQPVDEQTETCSRCGGKLYIGSYPFCKGSPTDHETVMSRSAQGFQPFVYFKSADGKTSIPGNASDPAPPGYVRCEVRNFRERDRFYKEQNQQARDDWERANQQQYEAGEAYLREQRKQLFHDMQHFTPQGRALAEHAIKKANERPAPSYQANSFIEAFEMDRGNREAHRDPDGKRWY